MNILDRVLSRLEHVRQAGKGWVALCPAHADKTPSLSVASTEDGRVLIHCFGGCSVYQIVEALGIKLADLFPRSVHALTADERRAFRLAKLHTDWDAALGVIVRESTVVLIVARPMLAIASEDFDRLHTAVDRLGAARQVLHGR